MLTSDAGLLPIREFDETLGFTRQFADALLDTRDARFTSHSFLEMATARIFGILADYEDQNDPGVAGLSATTESAGSAVRKFAQENNKSRIR